MTSEHATQRRRSYLTVVSQVLGIWLAVTASQLPADDTSVVEDAIGQAAEKFVEAYNSKDAEGVASLFGPNARLEEADGTLVVGREEIQAAFEVVFEAEPKAAISVTMDSIQLVTPDVAVEEGSTEYFPDGETLTSRSQYIAVHLKKEGKWQMASVRSMNREVLSNYEYLRALEWMMGDWIDESPTAVVKTSCRWDDDRNYILQDFEVHDDAGLALRGTQRIGWDPQKKQFRSWIFDHSGAFAEGRWTPTDNGWVMKLSGVSPDGATASATRRFYPEGPERIVVTITDRLLGSEELPDTTIVMVRPPAPPQAVSSTE